MHRGDEIYDKSIFLSRPRESDWDTWRRAARRQSGERNDRH